MTATPPLLQLIEGRRVRPRKAPVERPREIVLHMAVADLLRKRANSAWRWTHVASGELRDIRTASKLKRMGMQKGWPDFVLISPDGRFHGLELKREGAGLSEAQQDFQVWAAARGIAFCVAETMRDVLAVLEHWGAVAPVSEVRS